MVVTLIGKNLMYKLLLPQNAVGNYWLSDREGEKGRKLINIQGIDGEWQIVNSNILEVMDFKIIDREKNNMRKNEKQIGESVVLEEYEMYGIRFRGTEELFILYCSPTYEDNLIHLDIRKKADIYIGKGVHNQIVYTNKMMANTQAQIFQYEGRWMIKNFDNQFGTFVNNKPVKKDTILSNGDVIFMMGLKIIIMGMSIFINNPQKKVTCSKEMFRLDNIKVNTIIDSNEIDEEMYSENDYFSRAPRISNIIEHEKVKIDAPPHLQDDSEMPLILAMGSSLSMGIIMMVSIFNAINGQVSGTSTTTQMVTSLVVAFAMLVSMVLFPILTNKWNKRKKKKYEEKRQDRYKKYLNSKSNVINEIINKQKNILFENYPSPEECTQIILSKGARLWERKIDDYDFLTVRLGVGDVPVDMEIQYPEEQFTMEDDNLVEILNNIVDNSKILKDSPIVMSLAEKNVSAIIASGNEKVERFIKSLIIQLVAFHSYEDLKLVFLLKEDEEDNLEFVKMLPHVWDNSKQIRFFAYDYDEMNEISKHLEEVLQNRLQYENKDYKSFAPYYLIITNDYKKVENLKIITEILKTKVNVGFSILCITNDLLQLPNECKTFISIDKESKTGMIFENELSSTNQKQITFDTSVIFFFDKICQAVSNIPIKYTENGGNLLPNTYTFLEMYDVGRIEQLNILERWTRHDPTLSLRAPIGIDAQGMPIILDIHEKFHGPHGLIAGSTGSGKSEFIITYILSLAINYHPDDVNFILIDYKGGGLAGAFEKRNMKLPHLVGTITNIDTNGLKRSLVSIQSELRRRQVMFNEARDMTDEGTIDIYKYQRLYHQGIVKKPIPHLLIICDEFAELKQQQEDFMNELISVSRIGRSLGVHLILATQKPAGIVNDQIRSNSKFAVCLKVQDREDSVDVIKRPDAANLKKAGQFFLQVGNDEYFVLGQSAWSGAAYIPSDLTEKKIDKSIQFISNIGTVIKQVDDNISQKVVSNQGEQLTNIVRYMHEIAEQNNIKEENLWLDNIPENIFVEGLKRKYHIKERDPEEISAIIGEYDDPFNQKQGVVKFNFLKSGNTIVYGNAESGKETLLSTMIYDLITTYTTKQVEIYILDFGTEALRIYNGAPQVGDVVLINDSEKIGRFFDLIQDEIKTRKTILQDYNGDYELYLRTGKNPLPMLIIAINNYDAFAEIYEDKYEDVLLTLSREATKCGIIFVVTVSQFNSMRYRLSQNFKQRIALQLNVDNDYYNIFEKVGKKRPSNIFGRGLVDINDEIYEFQTAKVCKAEEYNSFIKEKIDELKKEIKDTANAIPVLPEVVTVKDLKKNIKDLSSLPVGIFDKNLRVCTYNFKKDFINIVTSRDIETAAQFVYNLIEEIETMKDVKVYIFDAERENKKGNLVQEYLNFVLSSGMENDKKQVICAIIGLEKFINKFELNTDFYNSLKKLDESKNSNVIIVDNVTKIKNHEYDEWFKNYISKDNAIWIGNGINNQYLITINSDRRQAVNNCGTSYGYVIKQGEAYMAKLLGMKDCGDDNE